MPEQPLIEAMTLQYLVLATALALLLAQAVVSRKTTTHLLFAVFCGSVALSSAQKLTGDSVGAYQYLIGMGACATCNIYWLLARSLFRTSTPIKLHHVGFAVALGALMMAKQGYLFIDSFWQFSLRFDDVFNGILRELITLLSSFVLIMAVWEGIRGFDRNNRKDCIQRLTFLVSLAAAIAITKTVAVTHANQPDIVQAVIAVVTVMVMLLTQILITWRSSNTGPIVKQCSHRSPAPASNEASSACQTSITTTALDMELAEQVNRCIQRQYRQSNLKVADVARALDVSEYRVSRILKQHFQAKNFNHFVNQLRVEHARSLLADPATKDWPVLIVGLESGFASVGPFTRAFKQFTGLTPGQYRATSMASAQSA
ncbi:hypothetical protein GCM10011369_22590 [Neiella marina]|uniref:HTH araC/xylS-type domain-containing protein n=1 Tax=Neiella marina TaxID=508461 RepID=A0A8J2XMP3_9GAMM|nr:helix-turn-helix transcriptional regulator [Neiella marina]GGA80094.1 hypothetical protein GCM10011369_22590 [Neiella marina]